MQSAIENTMGDLEPENATQEYPVIPYWFTRAKGDNLCTQEIVACVDCMECWPDRD